MRSRPPPYHLTPNTPLNDQAHYLGCSLQLLHAPAFMPPSNDPALFLTHVSQHLTRKTKEASPPPSPALLTVPENPFTSLCKIRSYSLFTNSPALIFCSQQGECFLFKSTRLDLFSGTAQNSREAFKGTTPSLLSSYFTCPSSTLLLELLHLYYYYYYYSLCFAVVSQLCT